MQQFFKPIILVWLYLYQIFQCYTKNFYRKVITFAYKLYFFPSESAQIITFTLPFFEIFASWYYCKLRPQPHLGIQSHEMGGWGGPHFISPLNPHFKVLQWCNSALEKVAFEKKKKEIKSQNCLQYALIFNGISR